ncbi:MULTISPECIES: hypothetical protein [unclassified Vibrio]|uniref:Uncharacterized protein n=1 Tax=Vibrio sp. HB236076 TaxID=3232307 RepID=A0AB39HDS1_9VIBR|nr:hypothetical protein [Vibrio sp. HB161653]MDP5254637.1 hypothetical protein [Vibrio sp. HB161653]
MQEQLINSLHNFSRLKQNEQKQGHFDSKTTVALIYCYSDSMVEALVNSGNKDIAHRIKLEAQQIIDQVAGLNGG